MKNIKKHIIITIFAFIILLSIHKIGLAYDCKVLDGEVNINVTDENIYEYDVYLDVDANTNEFSYIIDTDVDFYNNGKRIKSSFVVSDIECNLDFSKEIVGSHARVFIKFPKKENPYSFNIKYKLKPNKYTYIKNNIIYLPINHFSEKYDCKKFTYKITMPQNIDSKIENININSSNQLVKNNTITGSEELVTKAKKGIIKIYLPKHYFNNMNLNKETTIGIIALSLVIISTTLIVLFRNRINNKIIIALSTFTMTIMYLIEAFSLWDVNLFKEYTFILILIGFLAILSFLTLFFMTKRSAAAICIYVLLFIIIISLQALFKNALSNNVMLSLAMALNFAHLITTSIIIKKKKSLDSYGG